jgi:hypothetical protein
MSKIMNLVARLTFQETGAQKVARKTEKFKKDLERANAAADSMNKKLAATKVGSGAMGAAGIGGTEYRGMRGITGGRQAQGKNFSGMAGIAAGEGGGRGVGGTLVGAYATLAANVFALSAAFQALSQAARVEQLTQGLELMGARGGTSLKLTAQGLKEVTDNAISTADAMRAVAQASSAGLGSDEIQRLGAVARGAGLALGRDLSESMDRLTRGAIKLEPELLDELGIMVRLDEAVKQYAIENQKTASSLTLTERRQAFLNAVLEEGERKFGDISKNIKANPYDKLAAAARDLATAFANLLNFVLKPLANIFSENPFLLIIPGLFLVRKALEGLGIKFIGLSGIIGDIIPKTVARADSAFLKTSKTMKLFSTGGIGLFRALGTSAGVTADVFSRLDGKAAGSIKALKVQMRVATKEAQLLHGGFSMLDKVALRTSKTFVLMGVRLRILGSIIVGTAKLITTLISAMLPMIGITAAFYVFGEVAKHFKAMQDRAKGLSPEVKKVTSDLGKLAESSEEVGKQINKSMEIRDYSSAFQAAIKNIGELINMLEKLQSAQADADAYFSGQQDKLTSQTVMKLKDVFSLKNIFSFDLGPRTSTIGENLGFSSEESAAIEQSLQRIAFLRGEATSEGIRNAIEAGEDYLSLLKEEYDAIKALENSWSNIADGAKKAGQAIDKFYGPAFTKTNYSDVADSIKLIEQEMLAIADAGFSVEATVGAFDELRKGGASLAAELDSLASEDSLFFTQAFETASTLQAQLRAEEAKGQKADLDYIEGKKAALASLASEVLGEIKEGELAALSAARNIEQFVLEKRIEVLKNAEKLQKVEKSITSELRKQADIQTKINNLEKFGTEQAPNKTLQLEQELDAAREKARIESAGLEARQAVIDAEYMLERYKLRAQQRNLRSTEAAQLQGVQTLSDTGEQIGVSAFQVALSASRQKEPITTKEQLQDYLSSVGVIFPAETMNSLLDLVDATRTYNTLLDQGEAINARTRADTEAKINTLNAEVDLRQALIQALNSEYNISQLRNAQLKAEADFNKSLNDQLRAQRDLRLSISRTREDTALVAAGLPSSERTALQRQQVDLENKLGGLVTKRVEQSSQMEAQARDLYRNLQVQETLLNDTTLSEEARNEALRERDRLSTAISRLVETDLQNANIYNLSLEETKALLDKILAQQEAITLEGRLQAAQREAQAGTQIAAAGFGMSIAGGGDTFAGLVRQEATDSERSVAEVLADPGTVSQIKKTTLAIRENQIVSEGLANIAGTIASGMTEAFTAMIEGSKSAGEAFAAMAKAILQQIMQIIVQLLVVKALQAAGIPIPGAGGGIIATEVGAGGGMIKKYANGGIVGPRDGLAGIVSTPTYLVGEGRMNEAVVPLPNGRAIPVQMHGGTNQQNNVSVNITMDGSGTSQTQSSGKDLQNLGALVATAVQKELVAQKMPGGILNKYGAA